MPEDRVVPNLDHYKRVLESSIAKIQKCLNYRDKKWLRQLEKIENRPKDAKEMLKKLLLNIQAVNKILIDRVNQLIRVLKQYEDVFATPLRVQLTEEQNLTKVLGTKIEILKYSCRCSKEEGDSRIMKMHSEKKLLKEVLDQRRADSVRLQEEIEAMKVKLRKLGETIKCTEEGKELTIKILTDAVEQEERRLMIK